MQNPTCRFPKVLSANALKLLAVFAMTTDHLAWLLFPGYPTDALPVFLHLFGRITCPVMCFFIAEGFHYTKNVRKYTHRLFLFAFLSHFAYLFASGNYTDPTSFIPFYRGSILNQTGVLWSLAWGLVMLRVNFSKRFTDLEKFLLILLCALAAVPADWSCIGSFWVLSIGSNRGKPKEQLLWSSFYLLLYIFVYCTAIDFRYGLLQFGVFLALPLLALYNGKRGKNPAWNRVFKWLFYLYYPAHLAILGLVRQFVL